MEHDLDCSYSFNRIRFCSYKGCRKAGFWQPVIIAPRYQRLSNPEQDHIQEIAGMFCSYHRDHPEILDYIFPIHEWRLLEQRAISVGQCVPDRERVVIKWSCPIDTRNNHSCLSSAPH